MTEPAPWPLLRELGPEFFEVAVRAQVAWHGPTAAWAIAMALRVDEADVGRALTKLIKDGDVRAVLEPDDLLDFQRIDHDDLPDAIPRGRFVPVVPQGCFVLAHAQGSMDLWAFTLAWLARRSFSELVTVIWPGDDDLGKLQLSVGELIDRVEADGAAAAGGVRDELAVLGDRLEASGDPWGLCIAALLSGSLVARQEHEAALAKAVRAKKVRARRRPASAKARPRPAVTSGATRDL